MNCTGAELVEPFVGIIAKSAFPLEKRLHALEAIKRSVCNGHCEGELCNLFEDRLLKGDTA